MYDCVAESVVSLILWRKSSRPYRRPVQATEHVLTFVDVYKTYHNELPKSQQIMFKRYDPTHGTRQKETFDGHHVRTITKLTVYFCLRNKTFGMY